MAHRQSRNREHSTNEYSGSQTCDNDNTRSGCYINIVNRIDDSGCERMERHGRIGWHFRFTP